jgi:ribosome-associated protein
MTQEVNHRDQEITLQGEENLEFVRTISEAADDRKAGDLVVLKISEISYLTDYFVIVTGFSKAQIRAICDSIEEKVEEKFAQQPLRSEGKNEGDWILLDYGDVIVHIMSENTRQYYNLEAFWGHAQRMEL